ncbi:Eukaryotic-type carbonic anhydrase [Branchiostoma belcheri]|nr:Eukaryotic-type carbonic anhydrase [Branchiostoma belcheri]
MGGTSQRWSVSTDRPTDPQLTNAKLTMLKQAAVLPTLLLLVLATTPSAEGATAWDYGSGSTGPANWATAVTNSSCGGSSQSPINIVSATATQQTYTAFTLTGYDTVPSDVTMTMSNNGHSVAVALTSASNAISMSGGGLTGTYIAAQFHFHWGSQSDLTVGSEHTLNGNAYPGELHIVHYSSTYSSLGDAVASGSATALAVLGFFMEVEVDGDDNSGLAPIVDNMQNVNDSGDSYQFTTNFALNTMLPSSKTNFFRYSGSLTTPSCNEVVAWTVFENTIKISQSQMNALVTGAYYTAEAGQAAAVMADNYRPVQNLNTRTVYSSFASAASLRVLPAWQLLVAAVACAVAAARRQ